MNEKYQTQFAQNPTRPLSRAVKSELFATLYNGLEVYLLFSPFTIIRHTKKQNGWNFSIFSV